MPEGAGLRTDRQIEIAELDELEGLRHDTISIREPSSYESYEHVIVCSSCDVEAVPLRHTCSCAQAHLLLKRTNRG